LAPEKGNGDAAVQLLIVKQDNGAAAPRGFQNGARAFHPLRHKAVIGISPHRLEIVLDERIIGGAVNPRRPRAKSPPNQRAQLPRAIMGGDEKGRLPALKAGVEILAADQFDSFGIAQNLAVEGNFPDVPAEIIPHPVELCGDLRLAERRQRALHIGLCKTMNAKARPDFTCEPAAEIRRPLPPEGAKNTDGRLHRQPFKTVAKRDIAHAALAFISARSAACNPSGAAKTISTSSTATIRRASSGRRT